MKKEKVLEQINQQIEEIREAEKELNFKFEEAKLKYYSANHELSKARIALLEDKLEIVKQIEAEKL